MATYEERIKAMKANILGSAIAEELSIKEQTSDKLRSIMRQMEDVIGKPVYEDFNFRTGKIIGIIRGVAQNPKIRTELLEVTNLTNGHIDLYYEVIGNLPYEKEGVVYPGRPMQCDKAKALIQHAAACMEVLVEDSDLADITDARWNAMYDRALQAAVKAAELKECLDNVTYEE